MHVARRGHLEMQNRRVGGIYGICSARISRQIREEQWSDEQSVEPSNLRTRQNRCKYTPRGEGSAGLTGSGKAKLAWTARTRQVYFSFKQSRM